MSRGKKSEQQPFSLFSFQDIITCVTGIMLFIVLMFTLQLIVKKVASAADQENDAGRIEHMQQQLAEMANEKQQLLEWLNRSRATVMKSLNLDTSELPGKISRLKTHVERLEIKMEETRRETEKSEKEANDTEQALARKEAKLDELKKKQTELADTQADNRSEIDEIREKIEAKMREAANVIDVNASRLNGKKPIIIECSDAKIKINLEQKGRSAITITGTSEAAMMRQLKEFLGERSNSSEYLAVMLKPSASGYFQDLRKMAKSMNFEIGFEPFAEEWEADF